MIVYIDESGTHKQDGRSTTAVVYIEVDYEQKFNNINDKSQPGVQVADCIAGLVRRHYDDQSEENPKKWFNRLKKDKKLTMQLLFGE